MDEICSTIKFQTLNTPARNLRPALVLQYIRAAHIVPNRSE